MKDDEQLTLGQRIKKARALHEPKLKQEDLARRAGLTQAAVSRLENDNFTGTAKVVALAAALNVSPVWLQTGKGTMKPPGGEEQSELQRLSHAVQRLGLTKEQIEELVDKAIIIATKMM